MDNYRAVALAVGFEEAEDEIELISAWQHLIDTGLAWQLQGYFGSTAQALIDSGVCDMRVSREPDIGPVSDYQVAPHRYLYTELVGAEALLGVPEPTYKEVKAAAPYKVGEVVYAIYGDIFAKVIITYVYAQRTIHGDLREVYMGRRETKKGTWHKRPYELHPGYIQRGYQRAGLAPEMPADG